MKIVFSLITCLLSFGINAQELQKNYSFDASYDLYINRKSTWISTQEESKYGSMEVKARIYFNKAKDIILIDQLETSKDRPLELSILDLKNGLEIRLRDKNNKEAKVKPYSTGHKPASMMEKYDFILSEWVDENGVRTNKAKYIVDTDDLKVDATVVLTDQDLVSYLEWMPLIDYKPEYFPKSIDYLSTSIKGDMEVKMNVEVSKIQLDNPFSFKTTDLIIPDAEN